MAPVLRHCPCLRPEHDDIRQLDYSHSNLDDLPNEVFGYERTLEELCLDANQIKDLPRPLFHCHGLRKLKLSDNEVQTLPSAIASLINLEHLDISKNGVLEIPDSIKGCKCLTLIDASVNPLGKLPEGFTFLLNLQELYLNDTFLEYLPANFGRLVHLKILELRENHLKLLPKSMARLIELCRLDIGQNDFTHLPEVIGNLPRLVELWCDSNNLNCLPPFLGGLKKLAYLDASKNKIYEIADEIEGCASLCDLTLSSNRIKVLPDGIANLRRLTVLRVDENRIMSVPENLGNLCNLEELVLSSNNIKSLPPSLGLLRSLRTFIADDNLLEELPSEIGSCLKLTILSLRDNKLVHIPDELGHITALKVINLSGNLLQYLPFSIAKLPNLQALWLSENQNKPLIPLQSDTDRMSGIKVLTCFMLPQVPLDEEVIDVPDVQVGVRSAEKGRPLIKFAFDAEKDQPSGLVRAPTPYPKELKAHARHARNYALKKQGSKESEGNASPVCDGAEGLHATGATPDIMIVLPTATTADDSQLVKEAVVARPKSPLASPSKHERHYIPKNVSSQEEMKFLEQNPLQMSHPIHSDELTAKVLGRRDSRGDGSSSENTSTSAAGSPKLTPDGTLTQTYSNPLKSEKNSHFKKNIPPTGKRDTWMRQRLLRQGSGDSDRGYRSDHEVYVSERDQFGQQCYHDGYASDWEAFLAKQNYEGPNSTEPPHTPQHYNRNSLPPGDMAFRGHAEGQEVKEYQWAPRFHYPEENVPNLVNEEYQARMTPPYNGYWQADPVSGQYFPVYDMSHSYPPAVDMYERNSEGEASVPLQPSYYEDSDGYKHPSPHYWMQPPSANPPSIPLTNPGTLPRRLGAASPRLKRAQCLSVQAPLHGSPQEYHLMPHQTAPMMPNTSPRPGRSPSPGVENRAPYSPQLYSKFPPPHYPPQYSGQPYPITTQPLNTSHFPYHSSPVYPTLPASPRLKQQHMYQASAVDDSALVYPPSLNYQPADLYNPDVLNRMQDAEYGSVPSPTLPYRCGSIPAQIQNIDNCDTIQHLHRSVPSINIIPSTSPPQTSYMTNPDLYKGDSANVSPPPSDSIKLSRPPKKSNGSEETSNSEKAIENQKSLNNEEANSHSKNLSNSYVVVSPKAVQQVPPLNNFNSVTKPKEFKISTSGDEVSSFRKAGCFQAVPVNIPSVHAVPRKKDSIESVSSKNEGPTLQNCNDLNLNPKTLNSSTKSNDSASLSEPKKHSSYVSGIIDNINKSLNEQNKEIECSAMKNNQTQEVSKSQSPIPKVPGYPVPLSPSNKVQSEQPPVIPKKDKTAVTMRNIIPNLDQKINVRPQQQNNKSEQVRTPSEAEKRAEMPFTNNTHSAVKNESLSQSKISLENNKNAHASKKEADRQQPLHPSESNKASDKRFQKVLPPIDKTFQLKPCTARPIQSSPHHSEPNQESHQQSSPKLSSERKSLVEPDPPVIPPKRTTSKTNQESVHFNANHHSNNCNDNFSKPSDKIELVQSKNQTDLSQFLVDIVQSKEVNNVKNVQLQKGNMPDLISRIIPDEKDALIILEQPPRVLKSVNSEEDELSKDNFSFNMEKDKKDTPDSPKRQSWFFGSHKNSLVFPVVVSRNPEFGFSIEGGIGSPRNPGKPYDNGIYVAHVIADGPASNLLKPGDKILQVDGKDFTQLDHNKAVAVLQECGATISLMVSRE